jgi:predicted acetyltransferase
MSAVRPVPDEALDEYMQLEQDVYTVWVTFPDGTTLRARLPEWAALAAYDGDRLAGRLVIYPIAMWLNGRSIATGGISGVAVRTEYRRQGHASALLRGALATLREAHIPLALLWPTFYRLYRRNGFALAFRRQVYHFRARDLVLPAAAPSGQYTLVQPVDWQRLAPLYERFAPLENGALARADWWWHDHVLGRTAGPERKALFWQPAADTPPEGYLLFQHHWADASLRASRLKNELSQRLLIQELIATTPRAYRALIDWIAATDLADDTRWVAPESDPLPSLVEDPRALAVESSHGLMLRIVDLPAAFAARPGSAESAPVRLNLAVTDAQAPWNAGTWLVSLEDGRLTANRTFNEPDLACGIDTLSALYNGFLSPQAAWTAGLLSGEVSAVAALARCLATTVRPAMRETF